MAELHLGKFELYRCGLKSLLRIKLSSGLFTGFERQGFSKLNCNTTREVIYIINPADMTRADEICHIERFIRSVTGNTETSGYMLARI